MPEATFYVIMPPPTKCHFWLSQSAYQISAQAICVAAWLRLDHVTCVYLSPGGNRHRVSVPCGSWLSEGEAELYALVSHLHRIACAHYCWMFRTDWCELAIIEYIIVSIPANYPGTWVLDASRNVIITSNKIHCFPFSFFLKKRNNNVYNHRRNKVFCKEMFM